MTTPMNKPPIMKSQSWGNCSEKKVFAKFTTKLP